LFSLELGNNQINDQGFTHLISALTRNSTLSEFHASDNPITNISVQALVESLAFLGPIRISRLREEYRPDLEELDATLVNQIEASNRLRMHQEFHGTEKTKAYLNTCRKLILIDLPLEVKYQIAKWMDPFHGFDSCIVSHVLLDRATIGKLPFRFRFSNTELIRMCFCVQFSLYSGA
jgi:hypothetical protein